jgi:hypothetical protein
LLSPVTAAAGVLTGADGAGAPPAGGARALEVIDRQSARIDELTRQNAELRELVARQGDQLAEANATIAVLQRMLFGRSSEKAGPTDCTGSYPRGGRRRRSPAAPLGLRSHAWTLASISSSEAAGFSRRMRCRYIRTPASHRSKTSRNFATSAAATHPC